MFYNCINCCKQHWFPFLYFCIQWSSWGLCPPQATFVMSNLSSPRVVLPSVNCCCTGPWSNTTATQTDPHCCPNIWLTSIQPSLTCWVRTKTVAQTGAWHDCLNSLWTLSDVMMMAMRSSYHQFLNLGAWFSVHPEGNSENWIKCLSIWTKCIMQFPQLSRHV